MHFRIKGGSYHNTLQTSCLKEGEAVEENKNESAKFCSKWTTGKLKRLSNYVQESRHKTSLWNKQHILINNWQPGQNKKLGTLLLDMWASETQRLHPLCLFSSPLFYLLWGPLLHSKLPTQCVLTGPREEICISMSRGFSWGLLPLGYYLE